MEGGWRKRWIRTEMTVGREGSGEDNGGAAEEMYQEAER